MKISTKGRYGVRLMLDLARHFDQGPVYLKDIARREDISEKYLWHLASQLKSAGLLYTMRGSRGGYGLSKAPKLITLKDVVCALEGDICVVDCVNGSSCKRMRMCSTRTVWQALTKAVADTLESYTLEKVLEQEGREKNIQSYSI